MILIKIRFIKNLEDCNRLEYTVDIKNATGKIFLQLLAYFCLSQALAKRSNIDCQTFDIACQAMFEPLFSS